MSAASASPETSWLRRFIVAVLLAHLLAVMALVAWPELHELLHGHAHAASDFHSQSHHDLGSEHDCAVTLFLRGSFSMAEALPVCTCDTFSWAPIGHFRPYSAWVENLFLSRSVMEHAPPSPPFEAGAEASALS